MKKLDKIILALFSVIIFIESVLAICLVIGVIDISIVDKYFVQAFNQYNTSRIILGTAIVCLLCAFKCIFFESDEKDSSGKGILLQNDNGKLLISKSTIENIVKSAVKEFNSVEDVGVTTNLSNNNELIININLLVNENVVIKELTTNIQNKIKEAIKKTSDLDVKEVNVKIKDIYVKKENKE